MPHIESFIDTAIRVCQSLDKDKIEHIAQRLHNLQGRLFILGVGGSSANASHAVNDFRKLCGIEAYAPTDNVAELTARTNDEGWDTTFSEWLGVSKLSNKDAILVLSVGGGTEYSSPNIVRAIKVANIVGAQVFGIVGINTGYTAHNSTIAVIIPPIEAKWLTPMSEAFQMIVLHAIVSHPLLQKKPTKW